ncbi:MAG: helix-turn-helix domain-containing protein [Roseburia sp.]|nr:helix-turn-helix domain-containing protein [Roseburia sp.]
MDIFEQRLRNLRREKNYTQKELANRLHTTDDSVFSWEKGRCQPPIEMIRRICIEFNITSDYLLGLENEDGSKISNNTYNNYGTRKGDVKF